MKVLSGIPVVDGIVIAEALVLDTEHYRIKQRYYNPEDEGATDAEMARFNAAREACKAEVARQRGQVAGEVSEIFGFHEALYDDPMLLKFVEKHVTEECWTPEHAVSKHVAKLRKQFEGQRWAIDLDDFGRRLLKHLLGEKRESLQHLTSPVILIAADLTPSQVVELPEKWVRGFATDHGGRTSHTAILAQSRDLPSVVGLGRISGATTGGDLVILDGTKGKVLIDPDPATLEKYRERQRRFLIYQEELKDLRYLPAETLDGHEINLFANIEYPDEIDRALQAGAQGIGLYRTEFLYDEENTDPSEEDHYAAYAKAVDLLEGRPLVIRTLDLGADKFTPEDLRAEKNPFLGCRSIRYCLLENQEVFRRQLRAILRASSRGDVRIMLPMISSLKELTEARALIDRVKLQLRRKGESFRENIPVGIMIEVPSAAIMADVLAQYADFFSIGTNDLVQYTLAVDRVNETVHKLYQPTHPAIFRLVLTTIEAARRAKIPVSICGELSGDPHFTLPLLGLGMRDLSMASSSIPKIKRFIRSISALEAGRAMDSVLGMEQADHSRQFLQQRAGEIDPELYSA
ncbi:phosphoenolpyruvate--protein phosphotransferase [Planctomycetota bacterium]|nr:phosphoenolpyruvate--protein phosphotransferase [Planctomycetota bacterium]